MTESISAASRPTPRPERARTAREIALSKPLPERVDWDTDVGPAFFGAWGYPRGQWMPEHVEVLGPNNSGKSWFVRTILMERARLRGSHAVIVATKPADTTLESMGWPIVTSWPPSKGWSDRRKTAQVIFWAKGGLSKQDKARQAAAIGDLLAQLWHPKSNIIVSFDEIAYLEKELGLRTTVETYFREARTQGITVVATTQRPQGVTRYMHSESSWSVFFAPKDEEDAERMAQVAGNKTYYMRILSGLDRTKHEFLLVHNLTNEAVITHIPKRGSGKATKATREPQSGNDRSV